MEQLTQFVSKSFQEPGGVAAAAAAAARFCLDVAIREPLAEDLSAHGAHGHAAIPLSAMIPSPPTSPSGSASPAPSLSSSACSSPLDPVTVSPLAAVHQDRLQSKNSSIADLRLKAKKHAEALGLGREKAV